MNKNCDVFSKLYKKVLHSSCNIQDVYDSLKKFDAWIKSNFVNVLAKDLTTNIAVKIAREQLCGLDCLNDLEITEIGARGTYGTVCDDR